MAKVTEQRKVTYVMELDEIEAQALRNLFHAGIGGLGTCTPQPLGRVIKALCDAGIPSEEYELNINKESTEAYGHLVIDAK